ncbi:hypothetical protein ACFXAW_32655 [Streptomyces sp. NPDC059445]|uniref:hypothetical protein n=1 Tax=Streptomyces sp. NPDC059445 TaxID=3346832 RepID=UPI0036A24CBF
MSTTDVEECLGPYMSRVSDLRFLTGQGGEPIVLGVAWVAPLSRNHGRGIHPDTVGFRIDVHPVDATERAATRALLKARALPQLHAWIARAGAADETWRLTPHQHHWRLADGRLTRHDEE